MTNEAVSARRTPIKILSYIALIYAALAWGSTFILVKSAAAQTGPLLLVAYRFGIAGGLMFCYLFLKNETLFSHWRSGVKLGILLALLYILQTVGLTETSATNSGFITGLFVAFLPLFVFLIEKKRSSSRDAIVIGFALLGLWFLTGGIERVNHGDVLTIFVAAAYAAYIPLTDLYLKKGASVFPLIAQSFLVTSFLSFLGAILLGESFSAGSTKVWGIILFLALIPSLSAYIAQFFAQRYVAPIAVGATFLLEPVFAAAFSVSWGGEVFSATQMLGGLIILIGMSVSIGRKKSTAPSHV